MCVCVVWFRFSHFIYPIFYVDVAEDSNGVVSPDDGKTEVEESINTNQGW